MERFSIQLLRIVLLGCLFNPWVCLSQDRDCLVQTAENYVGVREATGKNDGEQVERFLALVGFGPGSPWCAAFVSYVYDCCDIDAPLTAWSPSFGLDKDAIYRYGQGYNVARLKAQAGDVFTIYYSSKGRIGHVGLYIYSTPNRVYTIEGNTNKSGSREGDGVYRKVRPWGQVYRITRYLND